MDRRSIILKTISCQGVKFFNFFQKPSVYAVVSVGDGRDGRRHLKLQQQKTPADLDGGENPEWNHSIWFDFDDGGFQDLFLQFDIMAQGNLLLLGDKLIGRAHVPITDVTEGKSSDALRHVSYQVQSPEGKPNGIISFFYRLISPETENLLSQPPESVIPSAGQYYPPTLPDASVPTASYCFHHIQPPPGPGISHFPTNQPATAAFHSPVDWAACSPDGGFSSMTAASGIGGFYAPPAPPVPSHGTYYAPAAWGYGCPPPQDFCGCWNERTSLERGHP